MFNFRMYFPAFLLLLAGVPQGAIGSTLTSGSSVTGDVSLVGEVDSFTFSGQAGDIVWVLMAAENRPASGGNQLTPEIRVFGSNGIVASDNGSPAWINIALPNTGTYTVFAQDWAANGGDTGDYRIHYINVTNAVESGSLSSGVTISGEIDMGGDLDSFFFEGEAGSSVWISSASLNSDVSASIYLYGTDGTLLRQSTGPGVNEIEYNSLPSNGTYKVVLLEWDANGFDSGDYVLSFVIAPGKTEFGTLVNGSSIDEDLTRGDIDSFNFFARQGDTVSISTSRLDNSSITREFSIYGPDGGLILTTTNTSVIRTLQVTGVYYILLKEWSANGTDTGNYRISFNTTGVGGGDEVDVEEVALVSSCLAGNGRVDLNIVNTSTASSVYRYEFEGRSPRQTTVAFEQRARLPLTGRLPGTYSAVVRRDGVEILSTDITIDCSNSSPNVSSPEVSVLSSCPGGNGFVLFQMVNPTSSARPYVIEFDGVRNRSTSAAAFGQAVRGTSGRPDGFYGFVVRTGSTVLKTGIVEIDCD